MTSERGVFKKILVPTDLSAPSERAWTVARGLARGLGAEVTLLHVFAEGTLYSEGFISNAQVRAAFASAREWVEKTLGEWAEAGRRDGIAVEISVRPGVAHAEIVAAARDMGADLIVIGTHGRSGLDRMLLGSVAERVLRLAPCPVLAVREPD
jgi:nucleotide-binding universal stress UspA family protein